MMDVVSEVAANMDRTAALYAEILDTERQKREAIAEGQLDVLADVVAREERLVERADELAAERLALRGRLVEARTDLGPDPRLRQVIGLLDGPPRERLARKHRELLALGEQINEVNRTNFQLLRCSMDQLLATIVWTDPASRPGPLDPSILSVPVECRAYRQPGPSRPGQELARAHPQPAEE